MKTNGGWTVIPNRKSRYDKYINQLVVLVSTGEKKSIYLTKPVMTALGNPEYVLIMARGSNIGLQNAQGQSGGFKVTQNPKSVLPSISAVKTAKSYNLKAGAYDAHNEGGIIVFDTSAAPSML